MNKKNKLLISVPYIYPVCPLSIDHAKIMLVADINARMARAEGRCVFFPVAAHYSGVTAEKSISNLNSLDKEIRNKERDKFIINYKTPRVIVEGFKDPELLLDYYTSQTIYDLKRLNISCSFDDFYKTNEKNYEVFVNTIFENYEDNGLLVDNSKSELALNYDSDSWRRKTKTNLDKLTFISPSLRNNIISSLDNIRSDWGVLRNYGIGVPYKNYVIDPMFDSELFVIYDLFKKYEHLNTESDSKKLFKEIFDRVKSGKTSNIDNKLVKEILNWLPTDLFVCEEHLKNWIIKKTFAETLLFNKKYHTKNYFITGMGYVNGERMSSSRGTAVLLKDLLDKYGTTKTRMIIMFTGGHPSKMYNYTEQNIDTINSMLSDFYNHINYINAVTINEKNIKEYDEEQFNYLNKLLHDGYYQQLLVDLLKNIPKRCYNKPINEIMRIKCTLQYFLDILLPDLKI